MVESVSEPGLLDVKLDKEWNSLAMSQTTTKQFIELSTQKVLDDGNLVAFFNQKLVSNLISN